MHHSDTGRTGPTGQSVPAELEREVQDHIGLLLRATYDQVLSEPVPDRFMQLLNELESKKKGS